MAEATDLGRRFGQEKLTSEQRKMLLQGKANCSAWRIVEIWSDGALPFDVQLVWTAGGGAGQIAQITVARAARVAINAQDLTVTATNLTTSDNTVSVAVSDAHAFVATRNVKEARDFSNAETDVTIPPYAERVRVGLQDSSKLPTCTLRIYGPDGQVSDELTADTQPSDGLPVGAATKLTVENGGPFRAVFTLQL